MGPELCPSRSALQLMVTPSASQRPSLRLLNGIPSDVNAGAQKRNTQRIAVRRKQEAQNPRTNKSCAAAENAGLVINHRSRSYQKRNC